LNNRVATAKSALSAERQLPLRGQSNGPARPPRSRSRVNGRRCKIPAPTIFASPNSLTPSIPSAILGGSCRTPC